MWNIKPLQSRIPPLLPFFFPSPSLLRHASLNLLILNISAKSSPIFTKFSGNLYYPKKNFYLFVCLFVELLVFMFIILGHPQEYTLKILSRIGLDLAEILRISKLRLAWWRREEGKKKGRRRGGILLCNGLIILEHPQEYTLKISWRSDLIWLRYLGSKNVYVFVCL